MTVQESTICSLIQTFPVLLILAQNHNRCVKTPLIYKPPSPTHSPEYYHALDALIHNLNSHGHGNHHETGYQDHDPGYLCYGYNERKYSTYGHGHSGFGTPCYNYGYVTPGHSLGHGYPQNFGYYNHGQQYPVYGFKKVNVYNVSNGYGVKGYAPNQVYNLNHKYKVVVKRNKLSNRRKFQKLTAGFFGNQPREDRRYGFSQNYMPRQDRYRNQVSGAFHLRPENPNSNPAYIYPFDNTRSISNTGYYDQYGRYQQNQNYPDYERQNYPQGQTYPDYGRPNYQQNQNYPNYEEYNNGKAVRFPTYNEMPKNNEPTIIIVQEVPNDEARHEKNVIANQDKKSEYTAEDEEVHFAPKEENKDSGGLTEISVEVATLPMHTPAPSKNHTHSPTFSPIPYDPSSSFISSDPASEKLPGLTPLQPVVPFDTNISFSSTKPDSPKPNIPLPLLEPVESSKSGDVFPLTNPESPQPEFTPLQPVETSDTNNGFSLTKPESPQPDLLPLQPVEPSNTDNGFSSTKPGEFPPLQPVNTEDQTTLPPLTPVPASELRDNFNFGPAAGVFQAPCETVEGGVGSCVSVYDCQPYLARLQQSRSDPSIIPVLRRAHCGFEGNNPKVCCPRPGLPTAQPEIPTVSPITTTTTTTTTAKPKPPKSKTACPPETHNSVAPEDRLEKLLEAPACGISNASLSRVVGGVAAKLGDFPFLALLGYHNQFNGTSWRCGGSLISSKHVLTAAHCIRCQEENLYLVRLGELDWSREDDGATPVDVLIKTQVIHKGYTRNSIANDIGLLVLRSEVQFTPLIKPLCLPTSPELRSLTFERYSPLVAGWGNLEYRGPQSPALQVVQLPVVSNEVCSKRYAQYKSHKIDESVLCAGFANGGKDACQGDSGGPLLQPISRPDLARINRVSVYFYQTGIISFGYKCAEPNFPGVYTRVTYFIPWLEEQLLIRR